MLMINVKTNLDEFTKKISAIAYKQIPFATGLALNDIAAKVIEAEQKNEAKVLDRPRPFTVGALGIVKARKGNMEATVFMKPITARYLAPYEFGGDNVLNGRALLKPIAAMKDLDQYGNLPRNFIRRLKGRSDIFIGKIRTKRGMIDGVWQRTTEEGGRVQVSTKTGKIRNTKKNLNTSGKLVLLVKFSDPHQVRQHLDWFGVAQRAVDAEFPGAMQRALTKALATAK